MYKHFIIISDSYQKGSRIGYKETEISTDRSLLHKILEIKDNLKENDIASYSTHLIETDKPSWKSIIDSDPFFKDILTLDDIDEFIEYSKDRITSKDIAEYVSERFSLTTLPMMKIVYYIYSDFLTTYKKPLFKNNFVAFKYGPVDKELWKEYRYMDEKKIVPIFKNKDSISPVISKLIKSGEYGHIKHIFDSLIKNEKVLGDPFFLKELTHRDGTPWSNVYEPGKNNAITDDIIIKYHPLEKESLSWSWMNKNTEKGAQKSIDF